MKFTLDETNLAALAETIEAHNLFMNDRLRSEEATIFFSPLKDA